VLSSAAASLDSFFEHPEAIQFPTPYGKRNLILRIHRAYPQPTEVWKLSFITWEGRKLQEGERSVARWSPVLAQRAVSVEWEGQPGRPPARGTRTIGMCSFDARTRGSTRLPLKVK